MLRPADTFSGRSRGYLRRCHARVCRRDAASASSSGTDHLTSPGSAGHDGLRAGSRRSTPSPTDRPKPIHLPSETPLRETFDPGRVGRGHPATTTPIVAEGDVIGHRRVDDLQPSEPRGDHLDVEAPVRAGQPDPGPGPPVALEPPDHLPTEKWSSRSSNSQACG